MSFIPPDPHDSGYKLLFSHPEMVRDLLRDWVPGEWVHEADFSTLERVNASYVADRQKQRHDDMVWRLRLKDRWLWVYLLLEFQSETDGWMALRMLVYLGLLAQDLVKRGELAEGKLPPILPVVLYNGHPPWRAAVEVADLFAPAPRGLEAFRPRLAYHLIDEARLMRHAEPSVRTAVEALFRLEHSRTPEDLRQIIRALDALLHNPANAGLRHTFVVWIKRLLRRKAGSPNIHDIESIHDLLEADTMLAERIDTWLDEVARKGMQQGRLEGEGRLLTRLLECRFGPLPPEVTQRLAAASEADIEAWGEAVLGAPSLDAVFSRNSH